MIFKQIFKIQDSPVKSLAPNSKLSCILVKYKTTELTTLTFTDTIINPGTMVVHFPNTSLTDRTMVSTKKNQRKNNFILHTYYILDIVAYCETETHCSNYRSGFILQHFGHLKITSPSLKPIC